MRPDEYQPELTGFRHLWRFGLVLLISILAFGNRASYLWEHARWWFAVDLVLGVVSTGAVWFRRRHPVLVTTFTTIASTVSASSAGASGLALVSLSTRRRWREIVPQVVLSLACAFAGVEYFSTPPEGGDPELVQYTFLAAMTAVLVAWGLYIGSRRELLASWRMRALASEAEQQAKINEARSVERALIAREMHDVLAHRISAVSMSAGALAYRTDLPEAQVRETARVIQETSHLALTELREILGVLREGPGDAEPETPQRRSADLPALIDGARATDMRIDFFCDVDLAALGDTTARTLYRCTQEALTNARKHAPAASVTVRIRGDAEHGVDLLVENPLPVGRVPATVPSSGFGLVGLAERVAVAGGRQSAIHTDDRRFVLHVWLPWTA